MIYLTEGGANQSYLSPGSGLLINAMLFAIALALSVLSVIGFILHGRGNHVPMRAASNAQARLARMYALRAQIHRHRSARSQQIDRSLADDYELRAARNRAIEAAQSHRLR